MNLSYNQRKGGAKGAKGGMEALLHLLHPRRFRHTEKSALHGEEAYMSGRPWLEVLNARRTAQINDLQIASKLRSTKDKEDSERGKQEAVTQQGDVQ